MYDSDYTIPMRLRSLRVRILCSFSHKARWRPRYHIEQYAEETSLSTAFGLRGHMLRIRTHVTALVLRCDRCNQDLKVVPVP